MAAEPNIATGADPFQKLTKIKTAKSVIVNAPDDAQAACVALQPVEKHPLVRQIQTQHSRVGINPVIAAGHRLKIPTCPGMTFNSLPAIRFLSENPHGLCPHTMHQTQCWFREVESQPGKFPAVHHKLPILLHCSVQIRIPCVWWGCFRVNFW